MSQSSYIPRVQQCLSPRRNWPHTPSPASECVTPPPPPRSKGGGNTLACGRGGGGVPMRTTWEKLAFCIFSVVYEDALLDCRVHRRNWLQYCTQLHSQPSPSFVSFHQRYTVPKSELDNDNGCGLAQIVAHRLAVRQARVRISARHPRGKHWGQQEWSSTSSIYKTLYVYSINEK